MNHKCVEQQIIDFIRDRVKKAGVDKIVIGLSGGIDSTVVAQLAVKALGNEKVMGIVLPYKDSNIDNTIDTIGFANSLDIKTEIIDITSIACSYDIGTKLNKLRLGNILARIRMTILYDKAKKHNGLVLGTTNKSELYTGYFTKYGDGGVDLEPIADLYKTEVFEFASYLNIPINIIDKEPSADLWEDQTDEEDLGIDYQTLDKCLKFVLGESTNHYFTWESYIKVKKLVNNSKHKRMQPECCKLIKEC